jgi:type IV pilus assembly protein PilP
MSRLSVLLLSFVLTACVGDEFQDLRDFVRTAGEGMRGKVSPPPEAKPYETFSYQNGSNLPDPFKPRKLSPSQGGHAGLNEPDMTRNHEMLEEYPLESLKMVGYLHLRGIPHAVVRSPDGRVHHVHSGNYMGQNFGQITGVSETEIRLREMVQDGNGDWSERKSTLQLVE